MFIEAPTQIQERIFIPDDHYAACSAAGVATKGNAAGNTEDYLDLTGQNVQAAFIPYGGFTAKGYVAMAFCVLSAVMGIVALVVYGMTDMKYMVEDGLGVAPTTDSPETISVETEGKK